VSIFFRALDADATMLRQARALFFRPCGLWLEKTARPGTEILWDRHLLEHDRAFDKPHILRNDIRWYVIDCTGLKLGRVAAQVAPIVMGKLRPDFNRKVIMGDNLIILNAKNIVLTGEKWTRKRYIWNSGYIGSQALKETNAELIRERQGPESILFWAIWGMLPKTSRRFRQLYMEKVYIYPDHVHPHGDKVLVPMYVSNHRKESKPLRPVAPITLPYPTHKERKWPMAKQFTNR